MSRVRVIDKSFPLLQGLATQYSLALRFMIDDIHKEAEPKTPKKHGDLRRNVIKQVLNLTARIAWEQEYAPRMEQKQFRHYTTPGTGPHFAENAVAKVVDNADAYFRKVGAK